jgi:hypothetical protein
VTHHRQEIVARGREIAARVVGADFASSPGACLILSASVIVAARERGIRLVLQAGSASWMRIRPEEDDGVGVTHFTYQWSPADWASQQALKNGMMPEIHCWAGDPARQELVDLSVGAIPRQCERITSLRWTAEALPDFLWGGQEALPFGSLYVPNAQATLFAASRIREAFGIDVVSGTLVFPDRLEPVFDAAGEEPPGFKAVKQ